jgi:hypothetical protein
MTVLIKRINASTVTINGNGNNIIAGGTGVASISIPTRGNTALLIYDGGNWGYNNLGV